MMDDKMFRDMMYRFVDALCADLNESNETPDVCEKNEKTEDPKKSVRNQILVDYTYADDGSDAKIIVPADLSDVHVVAETTYAMAYAIADVLAKHLNADKDGIATKIIGCVTNYLIDDTIKSVLGIGGMSRD